MRIGQAGAAVGQVVNHIATLQSDGNMFIDAGRVSNESNPVTVSQSSNQTVLKQMLLAPYGEATRGGYAKAAPPYSLFTMVNDENFVTTFTHTSSCPEQGCGVYDQQPFSIKILNDDKQRHVLTVAFQYDTFIVNESRARYITGGKHDGGGTGIQGDALTFSKGGPVDVYYFGNPVNGQYTVFGFDFGMTPYNPNVNLLPKDLANIAVVGRDAIAKPGELSRVTTTRVSVDVASGSANPGRILVGGGMSINSGDVANIYSSISVGGNQGLRTRIA